MTPMRNGKCPGASAALPAALLLALMLSGVSGLASAWSDPLEMEIYLPLVLNRPSLSEVGHLLITEVMFDPAEDQGEVEWIEILNPTGEMIELGDYKIGDEETLGQNEGMYRFPEDAVIGVGKTVVIAKDGADFEAAFGFAPDYEFTNSGTDVPDMVRYAAWAGGNVNLTNSGDEVLLLDLYDDLVDSVSWGSSNWAFDPDVPAVQKGHSIERVPGYADSDSAADWIDQGSPSPGVIESPPPTPTLTGEPTATATDAPTATPTISPTASTPPGQTSTPTDAATATPTVTPTTTASPAPTATPTITPTATASPAPTATPTVTPTATAIPAPTATPTNDPTATPTPGSSATPPSGGVLISEILYDANGSEPASEWIEIQNVSGVPLDISGFKIGDEETENGTEGMYIFPAGSVIPTGAVIVIANQATQFESNYGFKPDYEINGTDPEVPDLEKDSSWSSGTISLSNTGDEVLLLNANDQLVDAVSWGTSDWAFDPPAVDVPNGHSLERFPTGIDTDTAADWQDQAVPGPGTL